MIPDIRPGLYRMYDPGRLFTVIAAEGDPLTVNRDGRQYRWYVLVVLWSGHDTIQRFIAHDGEIERVM